MSPLVDQILVPVMVAGALVFLVVRAWRKQRAGKNCGSDCGCGVSKSRVGK